MSRREGRVGASSMATATLAETFRVSNTPGVRASGIVPAVGRRHNPNPRIGERLGALLRELHAELPEADRGHGWKALLADRLGIHDSTVSKALSDERPYGSLATAMQVATRLGIEVDYFTARDLGTRRSYRDWKRASVAAPAANPHLDAFDRSGLATMLRLTPEELAWVRAAPFRGGPQSMQDYVNAAGVIVARTHEEPEGGPEAGAAADAARKRGGRGPI